MEDVDIRRITNSTPGRVACICHIERLHTDAITFERTQTVHFLPSFSLPSSSLLKVPNFCKTSTLQFQNEACWRKLLDWRKQAKRACERQTSKFVSASWKSRISRGIKANQRQRNILNTISTTQLVVYYQCCVLIGWATTRLYVIAH